MSPSQLDFVYSIGLEAVNGLYSILACCALIIFLRYGWQERKLGYKSLRPVIAVVILELGTFITRSGMWGFRFAVNRHYDWVLPKMFSLAIVGASIGTIGTLCLIRVFSPKMWGHRAWVFSFILGTIFVGLTLSPLIWHLVNGTF